MTRGLLHGAFGVTVRPASTGEHDGTLEAVVDAGAQVGEAALPVLKALASETRLMIQSILSHNVMNVFDFASALGQPHSTVSFNLKQLEEAGLRHVEYEPGIRGSQQRCSKRYDELHLKRPGVAIETDNPDVVEISMTIGNHRHLEARPACGLASEANIIGMLDDPRSVSTPVRPGLARRSPCG